MDDKIINFPKKMEVNSPEIDSINVAAKGISNILHNNMKKIAFCFNAIIVIPAVVPKPLLLLW